MPTRPAVTPLPEATPVIDFSLSDENRLVRDAARAFVEAEILPFIREWDERGEVHPEIFAKMGELGFLGAPIPEQYGGSGMDYVSFALLCEELERADTAFRVVQSVHVGLNSLTLLQWGTEEQKQRWLVPQAKGEKLATFGLTEPGVGTDAGNLQTTARRDGDSYVLNGHKIWISLADLADHFLVFASVDREKKHKGVTAFVVERGMPGLTTGTLHGKLGIRAGNTGLIDFEDCRVPIENRIGEEGEGFLIAMSAIDQGRFTVAAGAVGLAQACLDASVRYAHERETFGQEIGRHQLVKQMIANMAKGTEIGRLLVSPGRLAQEPGPAQHAGDVAREVARDGPLGPGSAGCDPDPRRERLLERVPGGALPAQLEGRGDLRGHEPAAHAHPGRLRDGLPPRPPAALRTVAGAGVHASRGIGIPARRTRLMALQAVPCARHAPMRQPARCVRIRSAPAPLGSRRGRVRRRRTRASPRNPCR